MDLSQITDVLVEGIDHNDFPKYTDAYISQATYKDVALTEKELDELNKNRSFIYEKLMEQIY